jgi:excisionase family DNA binding protein
MPPSRVLPDDQLLNVAEVARALRVSKRTVQRWVKSGTVPAPIRLGGQSPYWLASAIRALLVHPTPVR